MLRLIRRFLLGENVEPQKHLSKLEELGLVEISANGERYLWKKLVKV